MSNFFDQFFADLPARKLPSEGQDEYEQRMWSTGIPDRPADPSLVRAQDRETVGLDPIGAAQVEFLQLGRGNWTSTAGDTFDIPRVLPFRPVGKREALGSGEAWAGALTPEQKDWYFPGQSDAALAQGAAERVSAQPALTTPGWMRFPGTALGAAGGTARGALSLAGREAMPEGALGMLGGRRAALADKASLAKAKLLARAPDADQDEIWRKTGWQETPLGWRFEIDPDAMKLTNDPKRFDDWFSRRQAEADKIKSRTDIPQAEKIDMLDELGQGVYVSDLIEYEPLFKNYPELQDVRVVLYPSKEPMASMVPAHGGPILSIHAQNAEQMKRLLRHELQHAVQRQEGVRIGSDVGLSDRDYFRRKVEVEARNVEDRAQIPAEDRQRFGPGRTQDVRSELQDKGRLSEAEADQITAAMRRRAELDRDTTRAGGATAPRQGEAAPSANPYDRFFTDLPDKPLERYDAFIDENGVPTEISHGSIWTDILYGSVPSTVTKHY